MKEVSKLVIVGGGSAGVGCVGVCGGSGSSGSNSSGTLQVHLQ